VERNAKKKKENPNLGELHLSLGTAVRMAEESALQMDLEESTSSAADSPVSPGVSPGSSEAQKMTATSGRRWLPLLKSYGLNGSLAKMCEALLTSRWASSAAFLTWKASDTKPRHLLFQLAPSMPRTEGTGSGLWPTVTASQARSEGLIKGMRKKVAAGEISREEAEAMIGGSLEPARMGLWATPRTSDIADGRTLNDQGQRISKSSDLVFGANLADQVKMWPTPRTTGLDGGSNSRKAAKARGMWPTPRSCSAIAAENIQNRVNDKFPNLESVVARTMYPTMDVGAAKGRGQASADQRSRLGGSLNPTWVEWLMGFPSGWTDLEASETQSSPRSPSKSDGQSSQRRKSDG
jgi:hypothetical protein